MKLLLIISLCVVLHIGKTQLLTADENIVTNNVGVDTEQDGDIYQYGNGTTENIISEEHIISEENNNNEEDVKATESWDCSKDEFENKQELVTISGMLKKGEEQLQQQQQNTKLENTVLVLGKAGAGKTTFVQFMAGDNSKLMSREVGMDLGYYLIEDGVKIGNSATESFTLYPEQILFDNQTSFTDTPGFSDTRSEKHEVVATYVMKKYLQSIKKVKIVLLVTYYSLQLGNYKDDFIDLLQNFNDFIKDTKKYENSIMLVATKVPNMYKIFNDNVTTISDEKVIKNIASYLTQVNISLKDKLKNSNEYKKKKFLENAITITEKLLQADEKGNYERINIFRQPTEPGALSTMPSLQEGKKSMQKTVLDNVKYSIILNNDIGYSLSPKAKNYLHCLLWYINDSISKMSLNIFKLVENHYNVKMKHFNDIYKMKNYLEYLSNKLKSFKKQLKNVHSYKDFMSLIKTFLANEKILGINIENDTFHDIRDQINSLEQFTDTQPILSPLQWVEQMKGPLNSVKENLSWCNILIKLFERLSSYEIQNSKSIYFNGTSFNETRLMNIHSNLYKTIAQDDDLYLRLLTLNNDETSEVKKLMTFTVMTPNNISCDGEGKLTVTGYYIKMSEINICDLVKKYCDSVPVKVLGVFAINTIFIDADLEEDCFRGISVIAAAPKWEIIGRRTINIEGVTGRNHSNSKANDGNDYGENGKDGMPGLPGGNGGNFLGIGLDFINEDNLAIKASGGNGGAGQDGGNGNKGKKGSDGIKNLYAKEPTDNSYQYDWNGGIDESVYNYPLWLKDNQTESSLKAGYCSASVKIYKEVGKCGTVGGNGGNGGVGGFGGFPGKVLFISGDKSPKPNVYNLQGDSGNSGKGGNAGINGENGQTVECYKVKIHQDSHNSYNSYYHNNYDAITKHFWKCRNVNELPICPKNFSLTGLANYTNSEVQQPKVPEDYEFSMDIYNYKLLLKENESNKFLFNYVSKLQMEIYKKIYLMKNEFWRFILLTEIGTTTISYDDA